jgi:CheY-like chemotaxis protein
MTANAMLGDRERCLAAGMDDYIAKPISLETIDGMLDRWLSGGDGDGHTGAEAPQRAQEAADGAVLDAARLSELRDLFPGAEMTAMLRQLTGELTGELDRIDAALDDGDAAAVAVAAHRLKNSAQMIGGRRLADAAARVTSAAREAQAARGSVDRALVETLWGEWAATRSAIEAEGAQV